MRFRNSMNAKNVNAQEAMNVGRKLPSWKEKSGSLPAYPLKNKSFKCMILRKWA